jgi:hypothetical protein
MAQKGFGSAVGLGTCNILSCCLKHRGVTVREVVFHQMHFNDTMNIILLEDDP